MSAEWKKTRSRFVLSGLVALVVLGCGKDSEVPAGSSYESELSDATSGSYERSYEYEVNGCNTGKHYYRTRDEFCRMLQDEKLNQGCAKAVRESAYGQYCSRMPNLEGKRGSPYTTPTTEGVRLMLSVSVLGPLDSSGMTVTSEMDGVVTTQKEGSFKIVNLGPSHRGTAPLSIAWLDLNRGEIEILGTPSQCELKHWFSTIRERTPAARFVLTAREKKGSAEPVCRKFLDSLSRGFVARVRDAAILSDSPSVQSADVTLTLY